MSKLNIVAVVEGVLRKETDGQPIIDGCNLFRKLSQGYHFIFLTEEDAIETEHWLDLQNIAHDLVLGKHEERLLQMRKIEHEWGYKVNFVVEPDPAVCARLVEQGFTVLGFFHPFYSKQEWRPGADTEIRPWDEVVAQVQADAEKHAKDARFTDE